MTEYEPLKMNGSIPQWLKMVMVFIDRVGFPILAFIAMSFVAFITIEKTTKAINDNTIALAQINECSKQFQASVCADHKDQINEIRQNGKAISAIRIGR